MLVPLLATYYVQICHAATLHIYCDHYNKGANTWKQSSALRTSTVTVLLEYINTIVFNLETNFIIPYQTLSTVLALCSVLVAIMLNVHTYVNSY